MNKALIMKNFLNFFEKFRNDEYFVIGNDLGEFEYFNEVDVAKYLSSVDELIGILENVRVPMKEGIEPNSLSMTMGAALGLNEIKRCQIMRDVVDITPIVMQRSSPKTIYDLIGVKLTGYFY